MLRTDSLRRLAPLTAIFLLMISGLLNACQQSSSPANEELANRVKHLEEELDALRERSHPELAESMGTIQRHHAKLYFAGTAGNWKLAKYQLHELEEMLDKVGTLHEGEEEIQMLHIIFPAIEKLEKEVARHSTSGFEQGFEELTLTCNKCHRAAGHPYTVVKRPSHPPVGNQEFSPAD